MMVHNDKKTLLQITGLVKWFPVKKWFFEKKEYVKAVDDVEECFFVIMYHHFSSSS